MTVGSSKMAIFASFARYIFRTFTFKATIIILYYVAPLWLFIDTETDYLEWSFCVKKSSPSSASNGLAFWLPEKTRPIRKFVELRI